MKLELKKQTNPDGNTFYQVFKDNSIQQAFWVGNSLTGENGMGDAAALSKAKELFDRLKANREPITEILQSEEI